MPHEYLIAVAHTCTPSACTWSEVASQYASQGFVVGLAVLIAFVAVTARLRRLRRR